MAFSKPNWPRLKSRGALAPKRPRRRARVRRPPRAQGEPPSSEERVEARWDEASRVVTTELDRLQRSIDALLPETDARFADVAQHIDAQLAELGDALLGAASAPGPAAAAAVDELARAIEGDALLAKLDDGPLAAEKVQRAIADALVEIKELVSKP